MGTRGSFPGGKAAGGVKLTTHLHLVPSSRMDGVISPPPQYAFMAWYSAKSTKCLNVLTSQPYKSDAKVKYYILSIEIFLGLNLVAKQCPTFRKLSHTSSYQMCTGDSKFGGKAAGALS
jgi:hypothetical protein